MSSDVTEPIAIARETRTPSTAAPSNYLLERFVNTPLHAVGGFFEMCVDTFKATFKSPFQWREFFLMAWFVVRVSLVPTLLVSVPFTVLVVFTLNILLVEFGAADLSGAGAALGAVTQIGPLVTVLIVAGAGATALCADLGARTIREEIDAMRVLGIDPIHRLVVPRVLASTVVALLLNGLVVTIGLVGGFSFSVFIQNVTPGSYASSLTLVTGLPEIVISEVKAALFGLVAGLVACYRGLTVKGGPKSVGDGVNETVVYSFMALFAINVVVTAVGVKFGTGH
ncbi:ABC transporter permease (plasmid) [Rhodococcus oxybenzonivorans]|jgi:phospholipid/cholesterol/gamma-HCH transport system permease protein|uniref:ABC transporter permease n=2 Tax=Nocardiaceae TaxID=85025 RepID=A0A2S2C6M1_9NOCA|nr:ABC transporter permease [Rhodococcus oxybenzonivorans]